MLRQFYDVVMDDERNPLAALPKTTRFQIMTVLALMWSIAFAFATGTFAIVGPSFIAHLAVLIAVFFTADIFRRARNGTLNHREAMRDPRDGTVLYDDIWGG